jgi:glycosyltransferase involved in cell wall biosynthesis
MARAVHVRHGIDADQAVGRPGFRTRHGIAAEKRMFVSTGGYWPNKRMRELAALFETAKTDAILITTGYDNRSRLMPDRTDRVLPLMIDDRSEVLSAIAEADCYLMHSKDEGFGLTLLEAMLNRTPWIAHATGGACLLDAFGLTYDRDADLVRLIETFERDEARIERAYHHVLQNHLVDQAVNDIEAVARRSTRTGCPASAAQPILGRNTQGGST